MGFRCGTGAPDCSIYKEGQGCGRFRADPDIAGLGVCEMAGSLQPIYRNILD